MRSYNFALLRPLDRVSLDLHRTVIQLFRVVHRVFEPIPCFLYCVSLILLHKGFRQGSILKFGTTEVKLLLDADVDSSFIGVMAILDGRGEEGLVFEGGLDEVIVEPRVLFIVRLVRFEGGTRRRLGSLHKLIIG